VAKFDGVFGNIWANLQSSTNTSLTNLSNLSGNGIVSQTSPGVFSSRTITGTASNITVVNGDGISGNPTINLATAGTSGTYAQVTTDSFGRVTSGSATQAWSTITGTPTTVAGYGITNAVTNAGGVPSLTAGTFASRPAFGTAGRIYITTDTLAIYYDTGAAWSLVEHALTGDVTTSAG